MQWIYLLIAAVFEAAWAFSLKYLDFQKIKTIQWDAIFSMNTWVLISPLLGYIFFGIGNIYFFALALKMLPTAVAMAVWTALALVFIKLADVFILHEKWVWQEIGWIALIAIGIVGLKTSGKA
ncbi:DMT family transporter [Flectobacillus rivi]|uniref:SMR family transporter n=1 Tax=Flectobacillus rivi TaxID=2984209 RepID=A0ABT6Z9W3_9BACT|nr:SMR family transporter [Flectobacillus rivi]MDI9877750.1 SMR family transporter [Flectobacillus rivi]